jgi:hypothetical protein
LRGVDLNHRPLGYEPNELPDCSTPRIHHNNPIPERQTARSQIARFDVALVLQFGALAGVNDLRRIDGVFVDLLFHDFAVFADEEVHAACGFVFVEVDAVLVGRFAAPVTQQREGHSNLVGEGFVGEGAIHTHTQDLGVGRFQLLQILLEGLHLSSSTPGESEDKKCHHNVFLAAIIAEVDLFQVTAGEILQFEVRRNIADLQFGRRWLIYSVRWANNWRHQNHQKQNQKFGNNPNFSHLDTLLRGLLSQPAGENARVDFLTTKDAKAHKGNLENRNFREASRSSRFVAP